LTINLHLTFQGDQKSPFIRPDLQLQTVLSLEVVIGIEPDVTVEGKLSPGSHSSLAMTPGAAS
jgi:hypothetical protein